MTYLIVDEMTDSSIMASVFSSLLILFGTYTYRDACFSSSTASSYFSLLDVGLLTLTQYILLDPILLCFMVASVLGGVKLSSTRNEEFSTCWWFWLTFTGTMLACCMSVKFVGLFVVFLVGLLTISDLWQVLGDMSRPVVSQSSFNT